MGSLYFHAAVHWRGQHPPKSLGPDKTVEATYCPSMHVNMRRIHPGLKKEKEKKEFHLVSNDCGFICAGVNFVGGYE